MSELAETPLLRKTEEKPVVVVDASKSSLGIDLWEWIRCRDLFYFLVWRDVLVRYKQTLLGAAWAVLKPLTTMVVFTLFLGHMVKFPSDGIPYPAFYFSALVIWTYFSTAVSMSSDSLIGNAHLLTKVYLPRLFIPAAPIISTLLDLVIAFSLLMVMAALYGYWPSARLMILPVVFFLVIACTLGTSLLISPLVVKYRDFQNILGIVIQIWMFVSPVIYPYSLVPDEWKLLYNLNPLAGAIEGLRWALFGTTTDIFPIIATGMLTAVGSLTLGLIHFRKTEEYFADFV
jgi:lipopolysaccharide transport system permease protein